MREYVSIAGWKSREYKISQGHRQGVFYHRGYTLCMLTISLNCQSQQTVELQSVTNFGPPMFADDLTMISRMKNGLDRCWKY